MTSPLLSPKAVSQHAPWFRLCQFLVRSSSTYFEFSPPGRAAGRCTALACCIPAPHGLLSNPLQLSADLTQPCPIPPSQSLLNAAHPVCHVPCLIRASAACSKPARPDLSLPRAEPGAYQCLLVNQCPLLQYVSACQCRSKLGGLSPKLFKFHGYSFLSSSLPNHVLLDKVQSGISVMQISVSLTTCRAQVADIQAIFANKNAPILVNLRLLRLLCLNHKQKLQTRFLCLNPRLLHFNAQQLERSKPFLFAILLVCL